MTCLCMQQISSTTSKTAWSDSMSEASLPRGEGETGLKTSAVVTGSDAGTSDGATAAGLPELSVVSQVSVRHTDCSTATLQKLAKIIFHGLLICQHSAALNLLKLEANLASFLPCDAMHSAAIAVTRCLSVRLSVCPSRSWVAPKRIKISSKFFHHRVATPF